MEEPLPELRTEEKEILSKPWKEKPNGWRRAIRWVRYFLLFMLFSGVAGVVFVKTNTHAAATITDHVLRPLLGDARVIALERMFFNTSDLLERITKSADTVTAPQFVDQSPVTTISGGGLDLDNIPMLHEFKPLEGEGVWRDRPLPWFPDKEVMAYTFVRPDPDRSYAITTIVQLDARVMDLGIVAGTEEPGGKVGKPGPGKIPKDIIDGGKLIAAFDGGFQYRDGAYGMIVGDTTYLPLKNDLGTVVGYRDGSLRIMNYTGQSLGDGVAFVRQNCPMLITDGEISVTDPRSKVLWGRLAKGTVDIYTWRSGLGITKEGNLLFAVGNNLTPDTLAIALKAAGAVNAVQLDINPIWVRFNIFEPTVPGKYKSTTLTKDLQDGSREYLNGYAKDFFYLYAK